MAIFTASFRDQLVFLDTAATTFTPDPLHLRVGQSITVTQTIAKDRTKSTSVNGTVGQTIAFKINRIKSVSQTLSFSQTIDYKLKKFGISGVTAGAQTQTDPPIQIEANALVKPGQVMFSYASVTSVSLRKPKFSNKDDYDQFRVKQESRGRSLIIYRDPAWPTTEILSFEFEWLGRSKALDLITFIAATVGKRVTYLDHLGRTWHGCILTPDTVIDQLGKQNNSISIRFQIIP